MIRVSTSVVLGPLGMANCPKDDPPNPRVIVCCSAVISTGKANGNVKAASVELLLVIGLKGEFSENIKVSWLRSIDLMSESFP